MARPTASSASPTATMWAWYQVVASWAVYQNTVPNAKNSVVARRTTGWIRRRPSIHQQIDTSRAARTVKIVWSSAESPQAATNGTSKRAGNGGKGMSARAAPSLEVTGNTSWKNALPKLVAEPETG